ncbi:nitrous oxide-stimulated promoter family protein [uncultured Alistipes sp.]|jgi:hypothetical protein|uniref:nitrous oxide-stimulated promoter family protein n=1 Tax=uncultured Alistipes sp. TaxID=538949 RepID=UPI0025F74E3B|nr:nitrous oxide-stimulated promoter family protein [uncultured Alistipes sp.]
MNHIEKEKQTIELMLRLYCRKKEGNATLCEECRELLAYAHKRLDACCYGNEKTTCKKCPTHCYAHARREKIREVMRYSGPRMLIYHPLIAIKHLFE